MISSPPKSQGATPQGFFNTLVHLVKNVPLFLAREVPSPVMRAIKVTSNEAAQKNGILIFENMRVPEHSVIHKVYAGGTDYREAEENLSWWETSDGLILPDIPIRVMAKKSLNYVHALIIPTNRMKKTGDIL